MTAQPHQVWTARLRAICEPVLRGTPAVEPASGTQSAEWIAGFKDRRGNRRRVDGLLLAQLLGRPAPEIEPRSLDERLWLEACTRASARGGPLIEAVLATNGPLVSSEGWVIEVWTETELGALQALHTIAIERGEHRLRERALDAARWHLRETQPDNATNRPWALAAFVDLATDPDIAGEAELYAQTLLHNALMPAGEPEPLSACILLQGARVLERSGSSDRKT